MRVLILGNRGQIGSFLEKFLVKKGITVVGLDLESDPSEDLRKINSVALDSLIDKSDFVFFLAYDVGGSTYLQERQSNFDFINNNSLIMSNCFASLRRVGKPFIFASSQMSNMIFSNYGLLKAIGERYTLSLQGISVKFWNVYGYESDALKFHVISDFIKMAINEGQIRMKTTGEEFRDFLFAEDCCEGLYQLMTGYSELDKSQSYDLASGTWTSILDVAQIISKKLDVPVIRGNLKDDVQKLVSNEPRMNQLKNWSPSTSLSEGISEIIQSFRLSNSL